MDSKEGRQVWENVDFGGTPRIALSRDQVLAAEWTLLKPIRPGGPHSLTEVLTAVAGKLQLSAPASSTPTSDWRPFASMVRRACQQPYPSDVVLATGSALGVDPQGQVFYSSRTTDELAALLRNRRRIDAEGARSGGLEEGGEGCLAERGRQPEAARSGIGNAHCLTTRSTRASLVRI